jgi:hypothetical protein
MTLFASARNYSSPKRIAEAARKAGVVLTDRGDVLVDGEVVGSYELAGGILVVHDASPYAPWLAALGLRQVD